MPQFRPAALIGRALPLLLLLAWPVAALAETASVDPTATLAPLVLTASAAAVAVLRWIVKRELVRLADAIGAQLAPGRQAALDAAVDQAAAAIAPILAGLADQALKQHLAAALASTEAQAILRYLPAATASLDPGSVAARITAALGDPLAPAAHS
jgi:hypothetical protein